VVENEVRNHGNILSKMNSKWYPDLEECDKNMSGITKKTGLEHMYMKMTQSIQIDLP
jgi:hypothetical protein